MQILPDDNDLQAVLARDRERNRIRQQRRRARLRAKESKPVPMTTQMKVKLVWPMKNVSPHTRRSEENKAAVREYWRVMKQKSRNKMYAAPQKHRRFREKEAKKKRDARATKLMQIREQSNAKVPSAEGPSVKDVQKEVVDQIRHLDSDLRRKVMNRILKTKKIRMCAAGLISRATKLNKRTIYRARAAPMRKLRKDRLLLSTKDKVEEFYKREDIAREMPSKRFTTKKGSAYLMQISIKSAWSIFRKENEEIRIGLTRFQTLRPPMVKLLSLSHREMCLCPYCLNVKFKVLALNRLMSSNDIDASLKVQDEKELLDIILCNRDGKRFHRYDCVFENCSKCSDVETTIKDHFQQLLYITPSPMVTWNRWERHAGKDNKIRRVMVTKQKSVEELIAELCDDILKPCQGVTFMQHLFVADWQSSQYQHLKSSLPSGWALLVMDCEKPTRPLPRRDQIGLLQSEASHNASNNHILPRSWHRKDQARITCVFQR